MRTSFVESPSSSNISERIDPKLRKETDNSSHSPRSFSTHVKRSCLKILLFLELVFFGVSAFGAEVVIDSDHYWYVTNITDSEDLGLLQSPFGGGYTTLICDAQGIPYVNSPWSTAASEWEIETTIDLTGKDFDGLKYKIAIDNDYDLYINETLVDHYEHEGYAEWSSLEQLPTNSLVPGTNKVRLVIRNNHEVSYFSLMLIYYECAPVLITQQDYPMPWGEEDLFYFTLTSERYNTWTVWRSDDLATWNYEKQIEMTGDLGSFWGFVEVFTDPDWPHRFYKLSNHCCSRVIGFTRRTVPQPAYTLFANQLDHAGGNTLDNLFNPMADGSYLPNGAKIYTPTGSGPTYNAHTWTGSAWTPNGNVTINPGSGAWIIYTNSSVKLTFSGLVRQGTLSTTVPVGTNVFSSQLPIAGAIGSHLGYIPSVNDTVYRWTGSAYDISAFIGPQFGNPGYIWSPSEPVIQVGEAFILKTATNKNWQINFLPCP